MRRRAALPGWLAAWAFWAGVPVGAVMLLMLMRVVPGAWSEALAPAAGVVALLVPLVALAWLPVAFGLGTLYRWTEATPETAFRAAYLTQWFALTRSGVFLAACVVLAALLVARWPGRRALAIGALVVFVPVHTLIAFDWLMSLDPAFHSSGFGLYVLSIQTTAALAVLIAARLLATGERDFGPLGALLLTALLLWGYFAFMQFLIIWSDNLPPGAAWYGRRASGGWGWVFPAVALLHAVPMAALLFRPVRAARGALLGCCAAVLAGKALETAWLVLPEFPAQVPTFAFALLAFLGLGALGLAVAPLAGRAAARLAADSDQRVRP